MSSSFHLFLTNLLILILCFNSPSCVDGKLRPKRKEDVCVMGHCLGPDFNKLELPSNLTHVKMNLEVSSPLKSVLISKYPTLQTLSYTFSPQSKNKVS